jgi:hypothetical protein
MAGDWIKMRVWIAKNPKVLAMTDYLSEQRTFINWLTDPVRASCKETCYEHVTPNVTRCVTVVGLLQVWGVSNEAGKRDGDDLILRHTTLSRIDEIADVPCFGEAMNYVGWAIEEDDEQGFTQVRLPNFLTNNVPVEDRTKASSAERQRRYRERKRQNPPGDDAEADSEPPQGVTSRVTSQSNDREEKRRVEKRKNTPPPPPEIPACLDTPEFRAAWGEWLSYRHDRRLTCRPQTLQKQLAFLAALGSASAAVVSVETSIRSGWQGLFKPDKPNGRAALDLFQGAREFDEGGRHDP